MFHTIPGIAIKCILDSGARAENAKWRILSKQGTAITATSARPARPQVPTAPAQSLGDVQSGANFCFGPFVAIGSSLNIHHHSSFDESCHIVCLSMITDRKRGAADLGRCERCLSSWRGYGEGYCPWCNRGTAAASGTALAGITTEAPAMPLREAVPSAGSTPQLLIVSAGPAAEEVLPQSCPYDDPLYAEAVDEPWNEEVKTPEDVEERDEADHLVESTSPDVGKTFWEQWEVDSDGHLHERSPENASFGNDCDMRAHMIPQVGRGQTGMLQMGVETMAMPIDPVQTDMAISPCSGHSACMSMPGCVPTAIDSSLHDSADAFPVQYELGACAHGLEILKERSVTILSSDDWQLAITPKAARMSPILTTMLAERIANEAISFPTMSRELLTKVFEYCEHHKGEETPSIRHPITSSDLLNHGVPLWDDSYIGMSKEKVVELVTAANYLRIQSLVDLGCAKIQALVYVDKGFPALVDVIPESEVVEDPHDVDSEETTWERRHEKRMPIYLAILESEDGVFLASHDVRSPLGPNPFDRSLSKRTWEKLIQDWRHEIANARYNLEQLQRATPAAASISPTASFRAHNP